MHADLVSRPLQSHLSVTVTFAVAANDCRVLEDNFLSSSCLVEGHSHQVIIQWDYQSASAAYNDAIDRSTNDIVVFAHQDVFFSENWMEQFERSLDLLQDIDPSWGVLGCYGITAQGSYRGYLYSSCQALHGAPFERPVAVQTLDEIVLITRKSSGLRFDQHLPHFHQYGADICLTAASRGLCSYAICAPCIHNTQQNIVLPAEFYECCNYLRRSKQQHLPIQTTCARLTRLGVPLLVRRLREIYPRLILRKTKNYTQVADVFGLVAAFNDAHNAHFGRATADGVSSSRSHERPLTEASG